MWKSHFQKFAYTVLVAVAVLSIEQGLAQNSSARAFKVGYVDADRILRESLPAKLAKAKIENDFAPRQREIESAIEKNKQSSDAYDREVATLGESERARRQMDILNQDRKIQRLQRAYSDDLSQRKSQELGVLQDNANKAIRKIAQGEGFDLIVQEATYYSARVDITDKVIKELGASAVAPAGK